MRVGALSKLLEAFESHLSLFAQIARWGAVAGGGIVTAWSAFIAELWLDYAPFSYVVAFFIGAFLVVIIFSSYAWFKSALVKADYLSHLKEPKSTINPIDDSFTKKRIYVNDIATPVDAIILNKTFVGCEIIGGFGQPVGFSGCNFHDGVSLEKCTGVEFTINPVPTVLPMFSGCIFRNCRFVSIIMLVNSDTAAMFDRLAGNKFPWLSRTKK